MLALVSCHIEWRVSANNGSAAGLHNHRGLELGYELTLLLLVDWVRQQKVVVDALSHTYLGGGGVAQGAN